MNTRKAALTVLTIALKIVIYAVIVMAMFRIGMMAFDYGHSVFQEEAVDRAPGRTIGVTIENGATNKEIAQLLEKKGLVEDWKLFYVQILVSKYSKTMEPGSYTLTTAMKPRELMAVMSGEELQEDEEEGS